MPLYDRNPEHSCFTKICSKCEVEIIGTEDEAASIKIFVKHFAVDIRKGDGFYSSCRTCQNNDSKRRFYGPHDLEAMWRKQDKGCAICQKELSIIKGAPAEMAAHIDHDENTGEIRELLCGSCNRGIGMFKHNSTTLRRAADYIDKHSVVIPIRRQG